jgi:hypothetical protein
MADIGWEALNDGDDDTFTHTTNVQHAFMELDFGPTGQVTDRVRVKHRAGEQKRAGERESKRHVYIHSCPLL